MGFPVQEMTMKVFAAIASVAFTAAAAQAVGITFIHTGTGTGRIGNTPFENAQFTITSVADTNDRTSFNGGFSLVHQSSQISIADIGVFTITTGTRTFVNNTASGGQGLVGFSRQSGIDLFNGPSGSGLDTWDLITNIGPISGNGRLIQWFSEDVNTNAGILVFDNNNNVSASFQAIIPAPGAVALLGMSGLLAARRRR
jgi:hypothetical protein